MSILGLQSYRCCSILPIEAIKDVDVKGRLTMLVKLYTEMEIILDVPDVIVTHEQDDDTRQKRLALLINNEIAPTGAVVTTPLSITVEEVL